MQATQLTAVNMPTAHSFKTLESQQFKIFLNFDEHTGYFIMSSSLAEL